MEETNNFVPVEPTPESSKPLNALQRFIGVFASPMNTLQNIAAHPDWIAPLIIMVLITVVLTQLMSPAILADAAKNVEKMIDKGTIPADQADRALEAGQGMTRRFAPIMGGLSVIIISLLAPALLLFVGNIIMKGKATFLQLFSVYLWSGMVGLIGSLLRVPLALQQNTMMVFFGPAAFFGLEAQESTLFKFFTFLDVFVLWRVVILGLGFAAIYRFTTGKSLTVILSLYLLLILSSLAISGLF